MDYKEKYNKLVEAVKVLQETNPSDKGIQNWVNENVPELCKNDDEKVRKELIKVFSNREKYLIDQSFGNITVSEALAWLEKQEQKPTEWSEEDENVLEDIEEAIINYWHGDTQDILLDWLKSLKQRYTWKSSEEQMKALHDMNLTGNISYAGQGQALIGLYNDLKKLKEG